MTLTEYSVLTQSMDTVGKYVQVYRMMSVVLNLPTAKGHSGQCTDPEERNVLLLDDGSSSDKVRHDETKSVLQRKANQVRRQEKDREDMPLCDWCD